MSDRCTGVKVHWDQQPSLNRYSFDGSLTAKLDPPPHGDDQTDEEEEHSWTMYAGT